MSNLPYFDVIVVGAGISGIGAAYHLQEKCPNKSYAILEGREKMGGTWDLFKYPGIRSDSDMYTLGFSFNPWTNPKAIADGPDILEYINETANKFGIDKHIKYNHKIKHAAWNEENSCWTLTIKEHQKVKETTIQCGFLFMCSGYYNYEKAYLPDFPGINNFKGRSIHPQFWDEKLDYKDKKVIVIGSGATAITLVPEMTKKAAKVYMLQRTPTYVVSLPSEDKIALGVRKYLPEDKAYQIIRWKNILISMGFYNAARTWPDNVKSFIQKGVEKQVGKEYDMKHFDPPYKPWDQRLCVVPDSDLFKAIRKGKAEIVTDTIKTFTEKGILLNSGKEIEADIVVTATGLELQLLGGMTMEVNGIQGDSSKTHIYRGAMLSNVPNFAITVGYTNSSWTLKVDLTSHFVTRVLNHMDSKGYKVCTPRFDEKKYASSPLMDFDAGYVKRAADVLPKQGSESPWKIYQNYLIDMVSLKMSPINDKVLEYK